MKKRILIIAGEASGDHHAADMLAVLRKSEPDWQFVGIGGDSMQKQGVQLTYHISQMAFLGVSEIVKHLPFIRIVKKAMEAEMDRGVDAVLLVDYPGFNLLLANSARKRGIPVMYYISPQLWAWREGRVEKIRKRVGLMMVIFKFEQEFYARHGIRAEFVGHPLADQLKETSENSAFRQTHAIPEGKRILGLFPGSREMEVRKLLPEMLRAVQQLSENDNVIAVVGKAGNLPDSLYDEVAADTPAVQFIADDSKRLMEHSFAALAASGTATLELGFLQTPLIVLYTVSPLTYWLGRMLIKVDAISLANIVLGEKVVPELIQKEMTADGIVHELRRYLDDEAYYKDVKEKLGGIRPALGGSGAAKKAAEAVTGFLHGTIPSLKKSSSE
ncbi:MAG: lipid-A-disaccharide synthase [Calditrichia bacterium]